MKRGQHLPAAAGVAVRPVRQVQRVLPGQVEHLNVLALELGERGRPPGVEQAGEVGEGVGRCLSQRLMQQRSQVEQRLVGIAESE